MDSRDLIQAGQLASNLYSGMQGCSKVAVRGSWWTSYLPLVHPVHLLQYPAHKQARVFQSL